MSRLATIRAAIVALASAVPDIGLVHDRERFHKSEADFKNLFVATLGDGTQQLRGWTLSRTATQEIGIAMGRGAERHTWVLRGYMAFNDAEASENVFDELVEAFRDAVRADPTFGNTCEPDPLGASGDAPQYVQVLDTGAVKFCGVLCHSAVLQFNTWSYL
jgi:hypothetical protein